MSSTSIRRKLIAVLGTLALSAGLVSCAAFQGDEESQASDTIKIGILAPQSGTLAGDGTAYLKAAEGALETLGAKAGLKIEVATYDEASATAEAVNGTRRLIQNDGVKALLSASTSGNFLATQQLIDQAKVPVLAIATSPKVLENNAGWTFRISQPVPERIADNVKFVSESLKSTKIGFLQVNDETQKTFVAGVIKELPGIGATSVSEQYFQYQDSDFTPYLQKLASSGAEATFLGCEVTQCAAILDQAKKAGVTSKFILPTAASSDAFLAEFGTIAEGAYVQTIYAPGAVKKTKAFEDLAKSKKFTASYYSIVGYTQAAVLIDAIDNANSSKSEDIKKSLADGKFDTSLGKLKFEKNGQGIAPGYVAEVKNSKYVKVWPKS